MSYPDTEDGELVFPQKNGFKMMCCDCGLVHKLDFDHIPHGRGRKIVFRIWRDDRATAAARRKHGK